MLVCKTSIKRKCSYCHPIIKALFKATSRSRLGALSTASKKMASCTKDGTGYLATLNKTHTLSQSIAFSALNIFLSITALLGNALILVALRKVSSVHPPTKLLFRCLAVTDLCVGFILQPLYVTIMLSTVTNMNWNIYCYISQVKNASGYILCQVSILASTAISVDRLLALLLGLRYRYVVTLRRVRAVIICFWLICIAEGITSLLWTRAARVTAKIALLLFSVSITSFSYVKIFLTLRQHQAQVQDHVHQAQLNGGGSPMNIARYRKTVSSIAWVQLALFTCSAPFLIAVMLVVYGRMNAVAWHSTQTLFYLNSSLNPILYCWKIREVRQAVKDTVKLSS